MVDLTTGRVLQQFSLPAQYFGEGLTDWGSSLIQLTWTTHKGFVYDRFSLAVVREFLYAGEGWGLTHDRNRLIVSDGSATLRFLDPHSFREINRLKVTDASSRVVDNLNELEFIHGEIYANVWHTDKIVRISPQTGRVVGWIDLTGLIENDRPSDLSLAAKMARMDSQATLAMAGTFVTSRYRETYCATMRGRAKFSSTYRRTAVAEN